MGENRLFFLLVSTCLFTKPKHFGFNEKRVFYNSVHFFLKLLEFSLFFLTKNIDRRTVSLLSFLTTSMTKTGPL